MSNFAAGVVVPIPTSVPLSKRIESTMVLLPENLARVFATPPVVVTVETTSGTTAGDAAPATDLGVVPASANAEAGRPPRVAASAAFSAYGTLASRTRG